MRAFLVVKSALTLVVGIYACTSAVLDGVRGSQSMSWPATTGVIQSSKIEEIPDVEYPSFKLVISYGYTVSNHRYDSKRVRFNQFLLNRESAERLVSRLPVERLVPVYFHPEKPDLSTLEIGFKQGVLWELAMGVLICGYGALLGYLAREDEL